MSPRSQSDDTDSQSYMQELETQLQNARTQLLAAKLQISDIQIENLGLKTQLENQSNHLERLISDNHAFEEDLERISS